MKRSDKCNHGQKDWTFSFTPQILPQVKGKLTFTGKHSSVLRLLSGQHNYKRLQFCFPEIFGVCFLLALH